MWTAAASEELYKKYSYGVFRRCRALVRNDAEANDLTQEVFVYALEQGARFQGRSSVSTFLFGVATHLCLNHIRNRVARGASWQNQVAWETDESAPPPDHALSAAQIWQAVLAAADEVTAQIAVYHFVDGLPQGEIAQLVGYSRVTVNQRLQAFRDQARKLAENLP